MAEPISMTFTGCQLVYKGGKLLLDFHDSKLHYEALDDFSKRVGRDRDYAQKCFDELRSALNDNKHRAQWVWIKKCLKEVDRALVNFQSLLPAIREEPGESIKNMEERAAFFFRNAQKLERLEKTLGALHNSLLAVIGLLHQIAFQVGSFDMSLPKQRKFSTPMFGPGQDEE